MVLCREWTLVKESQGVTYAEPLKCRCWTCDYCQPIRLRQLKGMARAGAPDTFLTLTVNPATGHTPDERARDLAKAWRLIRKRAFRRYGYEAIPFLAVFEKTKRGEPHLHILLRVKWLDHRWVSNVMRELIGAPIVDIRRVRSAKQAAAYVAKYVGKDPVTFDGCKRYWRSQDWELFAANDDDAPAPEPATFRVWQGSVASFVDWECLFAAKIVSQEGERYTLADCPRAPPDLSSNAYAKAKKRA